MYFNVINHHNAHYYIKHFNSIKTFNLFNKVREIEESKREREREREIGELNMFPLQCKNKERTI